MSVRRTGRHNILLHSDAGNTLVTRNFLTDAGLNSSNSLPDHGIYVEGGNQTVTDNVIVRPQGYGIHVYTSSNHDNVIADNTVVGSVQKGGIVVETSGSNIRVANNISANNATYGINYVACGAGCMVDNNITWGNALGAVGGALGGQVTRNRNVDPQFVDAQYHVTGTSPAVDTARPDYAYFPDLDGVPAPLGAGPDSGAYER
jgi:parallel beta-helix repeat protein